LPHFELLPHLRDLESPPPSRGQARQAERAILCLNGSETIFASNASERKEGRGQAMADNELFEKGLKTRKQVLGAEYVDANLAGSDDFMMTFQRAVTELAWGYAWSRPGLDQKTRCILTLGILAGLGRFQELGIYDCGGCERRNRRRDQRSTGSDHRLLRDARRAPSILGRA
jgi:hypothetical protein